MSPPQDIGDQALLGVAGVTPVPFVSECWWQSDAHLASGTVIYYEGGPLNQVISVQVLNTSNEMYDWETPNVRQVGMLLCANSGLSGGKFRLGVWDSDGDIKAVSAQFTCADVAEGTGASDTVEKIMPLSTTVSIEVDDCVGMIMNEDPTGTGYFRGGSILGTGYSWYGNWGRQIFTQGETPGSPTLNKILSICLTT